MLLRDVAIPWNFDASPRTRDVTVPEEGGMRLAMASGSAWARRGFGLIVNATLCDKSRVVLDGIEASGVYFGGSLTEGSSIVSSVVLGGADASDPDAPLAFASSPHSSNSGAHLTFPHTPQGPPSIFRSLSGGGGGLNASAVVVALRTSSDSCTRGASCLVLLDACTVASSGGY